MLRSKSRVYVLYARSPGCVGPLDQRSRLTPGSRWSASAIAQAGSSLTPGPGKANDALPAPGWITPHPPLATPQSEHLLCGDPGGGFKRPSNITRDYAPSVLLVRRAAGRPARPTPARPHNQRYVKWPQPPSLGASKVCARPCAHARPGLRRCARAAGASRARSPQPGPDVLMTRPPTCQRLVGSSQRKRRAVLRFAQALPPLNPCRLRWKTAPCTCGQVSTVLGPSRPSPAGSPLRSEALTFSATQSCSARSPGHTSVCARSPGCVGPPDQRSRLTLRAALVGGHVQKAFLGCHQP